MSKKQREGMTLFLMRESYTIFELKYDCIGRDCTYKINYPEYSRQPISLHIRGLEEME